MHQHTDYGAILYWHRDEDKFGMVTIEGESTVHQDHPKQPLFDTLKDFDQDQHIKPLIISSYEENPIYQKNPNPEIIPYLNPPWMDKNNQMVIVPVNRADGFKALNHPGKPLPPERDAKSLHPPERTPGRDDST